MGAKYYYIINCEANAFTPTHEQMILTINLDGVSVFIYDPTGIDYYGVYE